MNTDSITELLGEDETTSEAATIDMFHHDEEAVSDDPHNIFFGRNLCVAALTTTPVQTKKVPPCTNIKCIPCDSN
jgi:hypothetical protein